MTFEEITEECYYPQQMQPSTIIIYDEEGKPTITKGGEFTLEEVKERRNVCTIEFIEKSLSYIIIS